MSDWEDKQYFWVVICKNRHFHEHQNIWFGHRILLGETDSISDLPITAPRITVRCDACDKEYEYSQKEILKFESDPVDSFVEHPLFRELLEL
jgi:hypothetical protein